MHIALIAVKKYIYIFYIYAFCLAVLISAILFYILS